MYDFTGCECSICHHRLKIDSDIVVCPDCGTPYHRDCYHELGHCKHQNAHNKDFAWQPPEELLAQRTTMMTCPRCNTENEKTNEYCKHCGLSLVIFEDVKGQKPKKDAANYTQRTASSSPFDALKNAQMFYGKRISPKETFEGVTVSDWVSYIGVASPAYLSTFLQMKQRQRKYSFSMSALFFGPLYFFYRKAWDVALFFSALTILLNIPTFLAILIYTESAYAPVISENALAILSNVCVALSWATMMLRGLYGNYLYKKSSAKTIKKIQARTNNPKEKAFLLQLHGGTSLAAVIIAFAVTVALASTFGTLLGPEIDTMLEMLYY